MKIEVIEKTEEKEIKYPCLMISKDKSELIFATYNAGNCIAGIVLDCSMSFFKVGYYTNEWTASNFAPFNGKVILEND